MVDEGTPLRFVPKLSIARSWEGENRPSAGARFMSVDVDQYRYYFPHHPTYRGAQSAVFVAVRNDNTQWALVARRIAPKRAPTTSPPRIPQRLPLTTLKEFAAEVDLLQGTLDLPRDEQPTALFMNNHATKAYGIYPLGGVTLEDVLAIMPSRMRVGWMAQLRETTAPTMIDAEADLRVLRLIATQLIIEFYAALKPLHDAGYAMHDAKPANMVARLGAPRELNLPTPGGGTVRVSSYLYAIDYGNAAVEKRHKMQHGTCPFEAPEQIRSNTTGKFTDFWALGAVLMKELILHPVSYPATVPPVAPDSDDVSEAVHVIRDGMASPFDVASTDQAEVTAGCLTILRTYEPWYRQSIRWEVDDDLELTFRKAFSKLNLIGSDVGALVKSLLNPVAQSRRAMTLEGTLGRWLADHPNEVADANLLMGALMSQAPKQTQNAEVVLESITDRVKRGLDTRMANGKAK